MSERVDRLRTAKAESELDAVLAASFGRRDIWKPLARRIKRIRYLIARLEGA